MTFRAYAAFLIVTTGATLWGADLQEQSFRAPDPEVIYEAYVQGLIEYQDYVELLEISQADFLTADDSALLLKYPDLTAGFSSNPLFNTDDAPEPIMPVVPSKENAWRQSFLLRQYFDFDHDDQRRQLYRLAGNNGRWSYYGDCDHGYSGSYKWGRRYLQFDLQTEEVSRTKVALGNFKEQFGMGLIYGYHGQLLSKSSDRDDLERFLYPGYGGGNGLLITSRQETGKLKLLYDTDRNENYRKYLAGFSVPFVKSIHQFEISAVYGRLQTKGNDAAVTASLISVSGRTKSRGAMAQWEIAGAAYRDRLPLAAAAECEWRRRGLRLNAAGWSYAVNYPAFFSGGPSSRRSHTLHVDELDLSYSDRYSGETGVVVKSSSAASGRLSVRSALGYARREFDDDRLETKIGLQDQLSSHFTAKFDCYWRHDRLYSDIRKQRRVQIEIIRYGASSRIRLLAGHRNEVYNNRDDYLILTEGRFDGRWGRVTFLCKLDRLRPDDLKNQYLYLTCGYETDLGHNFRSMIKYTHRYRREDTDGSYGTLRIDLNWVIK